MLIEKLKLFLQITAINKTIKRLGCHAQIDAVRSKYLNNIVEQDHRSIKRRSRPRLGSKSFVSAAATLDGIVVTNVIRKGQLGVLACETVINWTSPRCRDHKRPTGDHP